MTNLSGTNLNRREATGPKGEGRDSPSTFPKYPEYKDSGVEWLGEVPRHWTVTKFSRHFAVRMGETIPESELIEDGLLPVYSATEKDKYYGYVNGRSPLLKAGDLVIPARGNSIGHVKLAHESSTSTQTTIVANNINPSETSGEFSCYWSLGLREILFHFDRTAIPQITTEYVSRNRFLLPPRLEQMQIASFLDHETSRIDALVEEQKRLIELLKEKRQAVISHAVTKGLDPDVPMKYSGVEWLGEVPAHWGVTSLKRFWSVTDCKHITADFVDDGMPLASIREVQDRYVDLSRAKQTTELFYEQLVEAGRKPEEGDLVFSRNATVGAVAQVAAWHPPFAMGQDVCLMKKLSSEYSSDYFQSVLLSPLTMAQLENLMVGSTFKRVNVDDIRGLLVPVPPSHEQKLIAGFIDDSLVKIDRLEQEAVVAVELMKEHRSALISAAVTGKIDVRGWQPPAGSPAPTETSQTEAV